MIGESGDDRGGVSGLLGFIVNADDDGCLGGGNANTLTALTTHISTVSRGQCVCVCVHM